EGGSGGEHHLKLLATTLGQVGEEGAESMSSTACSAESGSSAKGAPLHGADSGAGKEVRSFCGAAGGDNHILGEEIEVLDGRGGEGGDGGGGEERAYDPEPGKAAPGELLGHYRFLRGIDQWNPRSL
ncbi:hypothetical protein ABZ749_34800, partial [Micromonospora sp. NPDC047753]|uniref:hypothetical protein n=1 Tax=Micromonospora sp. NPDC047753 TaxID=3154817 RepID=UPI0033C75B9E